MDGQDRSPTGSVARGQSVPTHPCAVNGGMVHVDTASLHALVEEFYAVKRLENCTPATLRSYHEVIDQYAEQCGSVDAHDVKRYLAGMTCGQITTHKHFRTGMELMQKTGDLEFVRQVLRHTTLHTSLRYARSTGAHIREKFQQFSPMDSLGKTKQS